MDVVVAGSGVWQVDGEEAAARFGTLLRFDPEPTRPQSPGVDRVTFIGIGPERGGHEPRGPI